jgi:CBS domain-containing protein
VPGKEDWLARGLPIEGKLAEVPRVGGLARQDVVTCRLDAPAGEVRRRVEGSPYRFALVTSERGILLGRLRKSVLDGADTEASAESLMEPGPSTVRPDITVADLAERLAKQDLSTAIVSAPDGRLIGVVTRDILS